MRKGLTMFSLEGKTALVTGASGGIGSSIARALCAQGARVALSGTRLEPLESLGRELGDSAVVVPCNLSDSEEAERLPARAAEAAGPVDILVNNAGITRDGLFMRMGDEDWDRVIEVNLTASMRLCRGVIRPMMKSRWGRIINITSIVGFTGNPGQANYAASKAGIAGMSRALAAEAAGRGVTVNCVAPGFIETAMTDGLGDDVKARMLSAIPAGRMGEPGEVAAAVAFLASGSASYVTGQTLHVNGGMAMM